jgi:hypothetical protein
MNRPEKDFTEQQTATRAEMLEVAIAYAKRGLWIFPARVGPGEKKSYKSLKYSNGRRWGMTRDPDEITADFRHWPKANIGIPTGPINDLFVLDIDTIAGGHKSDGFASLAALEQQHGPLPETTTAESPSGSRHFYFAWPPTGIIKLSEGKLGPGIDVRGEGGMVIVPPSIKPGAGSYKWIKKCDKLASAPPWLLDLVVDHSTPEDRSDNVAEASIEKVAAALAIIPNDDVGWSEWNTVGMAAWAASSGHPAGYEAFDKWSRQCIAKYNEKDVRDTWFKRFAKSPPTSVGFGKLWYLADQESPGWLAVFDEEHLPPEEQGSGSHGDEPPPDDGKQPEGVALEDFVAYLPLHSYIFIPTREPWPASSVNAVIPPVPLLKNDGSQQRTNKGVGKVTQASTWLDRNKPVAQMTWAPGEQMLIKDRLVSDGGWFEREGVTCFNLYRPPTIVHGDPAAAVRWLDHIRKVYPADADHIINFLAQRVQSPQIKINHALLLGGEQGIGKDTLLEPVKHAVGPWNFAEVSPGNMTGRFNGHLKSVILRISEVRDLGDVNRYSFYEHMKTITAAPPDVLRVDEKNLREHAVFNVTGVIFTTNHKTDGIYLPRDDRRTYVAWSTCVKEDFPNPYWDDLWHWYEHENGLQSVAAYLAALDIGEFNPKAPPLKTEAFWAIVDSNVAPEESELADVLDMLNSPSAVTLEQLEKQASGLSGGLSGWLEDRKNRRAIPHQLERCGYVPIRNPDAVNGMWRISVRQYSGNKWQVTTVRQAIYAKSNLALRAQIVAARELIQAAAETANANP